MSGEKPGYQELSPFGHCAVNERIKSSVAKLDAAKPGHQAAITDLRESVLETIGIDSLVTIRMGDIVYASELADACVKHLPPGATPQQLPKLARAQRA